MSENAPASRSKRARVSKEPAKGADESSRKVLKSIQDCVGVDSASDVDTSMTVEAFLRAQCEAMCAGVRAHAEELAGKLEGELEQGVAELRSAAAGAAVATEPSAPAVDLVLAVSEGPYSGQTFRLHPRPGKRHLQVGRSTGKRFRDEGLSLPEDLEVSTTHLKIEAAADGTVSITDTGSTNGTLLNGKEINEGDEHVLQEGFKVQVGATLMTVALEACP